MKRALVARAGILGVVGLAALAAGCAASASSPGNQMPRARPTAGTTVAQASRGRGQVSAAADVSLTSFDRAFLPVSHYYRLTTGGGTVSFFKQAELIELAEDAYLRSGDPADKRMIGVLYRALVARQGSGTRWLRETNDDLMWAAIMCLRAYAITGRKSYLDQAKLAFDGTYARAWSPALGGGLWNSQRELSKNTSVTAPAIIAACLLYRDLHDPSYLSKAESLYAWLRGALYDPSTGAVWDNVAPPVAGGGSGGTVDQTTWTYNQGGLIGAADQLYLITGDRMYYDDALRTLAFTRADLTVGGVLKSELPPGSPRDASSGGFKGMFVRWAATFIRDNHVPGYGTWFRQNVAAVVSHANAAGLTNEDWAVQTGNGPLGVFACSSAVALLQWYPPQATRP